MNICFVTREFYPFFYGGIGSHFYYQMKMLREKGHNVFFVTHLYDNVDESVEQHIERTILSKKHANHVLAESDRLFCTFLDSISKNNDSLNHTIDHKLNSKLILEIFTIYNEFCSN